jgi:alpha/beta hydrolase fold
MHLRCGKGPREQALGDAPYRTSVVQQRACDRLHSSLQCRNTNGGRSGSVARSGPRLRPAQPRCRRVDRSQRRDVLVDQTYEQLLGQLLPIGGGADGPPTVAEMRGRYDAWAETMVCEGVDYEEATFDGRPALWAFPPASDRRGPSTTSTAAGTSLDRHRPTGPLASPVHADLTGFPPLLLPVGSWEILHGDATRLAQRAAEADVRCTLEIWPGAFPSGSGGPPRFRKGARRSRAPAVSSGSMSGTEHVVRRRAMEPVRPAASRRRRPRRPPRPTRAIATVAGHGRH